MDYPDIIDYLNGHATAAEREAMEAWLEAHPQNRRHFQRVQRLWEASGQAMQPERPDVDAAWAKVRRRSFRPVRVLPLLRGAAAAAILLLVAFGAWYALQPPPLLETRQGAMWASEAVLLPDGSKVWLHRESVLSYPESFEAKERCVRLSGEAYFEVARDEAHPFLIEAGAANVRVLGTSFGLMAYPDSSRAWVQVNSGRVALSGSGGTGQEVVLEKGEGAVLDKNSGALRRTESQAANRIAWRTRELDFQNTRLEQAVQVLEKTYGIKIILENPQLAGCRFTARFNDEPIESVLLTLQTLFGVEWVREGPAVRLTGEGCAVKDG